MKCYYDLYLSDTLQGKRGELIKKIENKEFMFNKYMIVMTKNEKNHLEFFDSVLLSQNIVNMDELFLIGIAEGRMEAAELVRKITEEVYTSTGETDIRGYLNLKQKDFEERRF